MINKLTEAIDCLKYAKSSVSFFGQGESLDLAIKALEKQIPTRIIKKNNYYTCPKCFYNISRCESGWCSHCGQSLEWES